ncbi:MAG: anti-sigma factor family protein, partial [Planctomycetota bacterium]
MNCAECKELLVEYTEDLLEDSRQQAVLSHLKDCPTCQNEQTELSGLRDRLVANGRTVAKGDIENDVMNKIAREQNIRLKAATKAGTGLKLRRIIMKSPITRMATAAVIIIATLVGINSFLGPTITFADVVEPILNARTMIFDLIVGDEETSPLMHEIVAGS